MTGLVIDASVAVKWFVAEAGSDRAYQVLAQDGDLFAPEFIIVEVGSALSRRERLGEIPAGQAHTDLLSLPMYFEKLVDSATLMTDAMSLSLALRHPFPDCLYLSLAKLFGIPLITADAVFVSKVIGTVDAGRVVDLDTWPLPTS